MKNNTKVRLHLSKALFESLTKQVLAESKDMSGGAYTEVVKEKKNPKFYAFKQKSDQLPTGKQHQTKATKADAERKIKEVNAMKDTKHMQKMEEKMSSKEKMAKGLYKEDMEETQLNEIDANAIIAAVGALSIGSLTALIMKLHDLLKEKDPEAYKKLQGVRSIMRSANPSLGIDA